ncbi:hypothetical protein [Corynebacterium pygosceleis]|uniref:Uncharacterized protein n=1 Tax=Corynebacterium pygosceleis TaxID=2800406 RepID=A0A9Q4C9T3_9CORY|nr:hypothetical protein [Corynebacterium pygosceleis]MCK7637566.1 hypothetical protein [Corynebacterium pygosceleis]MCK7674757.1 hypothetical protein [Corynebacterium pygosceleis]MCL0119654.1 hypothetical protein [Corynebacterium pygosceleis]MCX7468105.1 hypothetical protein [Corynebacterium pygosceleis]
MTDEFDRFIAGFEQRSMRRLADFEKALERAHRSASEAAGKAGNQTRGWRSAAVHPDTSRDEGKAVPPGAQIRRDVAVPAERRPRTSARGVLRQGWN